MKVLVSDVNLHPYSAAALSIHDNNNDGGDGNSVSNGYSKLIPWAASVGTKVRRCRLTSG